MSFAKYFISLFFCTTLFVGVLFAHPEDELCTPASGIDPALCEALQEADRADAPPGSITIIELDRPLAETIVLYIKQGFIHILPKGYDHILFVLGLFLASLKMRPLLTQIFAFTIAHTITLGLASAGYINAPAHIVEPLIALSIAFVALENIYIQSINRWRLLVVFCFGLFHGLGFAGVFGDLGLVQKDFLATLISFNIGVELGQLAVIAMAFILAQSARHFMPQPHREYLYLKLFAWPASIMIAAMGAYWFVERITG